MASFPWAPYVLTALPSLGVAYGEKIVASDSVKHFPLDKKTTIGLIAYGAFLALLSDINTEITLALAWLVALTAFLLNGGRLLNIINNPRNRRTN